MGTHFSFLFSIYSENHGVQAEPLNFARSSDITYVQWQNQANSLKRNVTSKPLCITNIEMIEGNLVDCEHTQNVQI